ncbi:MAG: riboflavin biosynthesis protein RibD [Gammaproteobacteria bacterium RIFCSPHIGHO2_12_FULL_45_9]|nr:MAG: riboflavin biosynthesis protein RibD [Gammaproteobacteria bacterium RIFCSPHIGHO2_12_FULL_45_9]
MDECLREAFIAAQSWQGRCAPNPSVGAVVVRAGVMISVGFHQGPGTAHAEVMALQLAGEHAIGATLYVTLEPCCHWGRTPPCTDRIIQSGIIAVYYGFEDPNPKVSGQGVRALKAAGIVCEYLESPEITAFYRAYAHWTRSGRPWVTAKLAMSLDGAIAGVEGTPLALTSEASNRATHHARRQCDAIVTTVQTILRDDPQLNARCQDEVIAKPVYVLDRTLHCPVTARIYQTAQSVTLCCGEGSTTEAARTHMRGRCVALPEKASHLNMEKILDFWGQEGLHHVWAEVGARTLIDWLRNRYIQACKIYVVPRWVGAKYPLIWEALDPGTCGYQVSWSTDVCPDGVLLLTACDLVSG